VHAEVNETAEELWNQQAAAFNDPVDADTEIGKGEETPRTPASGDDDPVDSPERTVPKKKEEKDVDMENKKGNDEFHGAWM